MNIRCRADAYYRAVDAVDGPVSLYIHFPFCVRKCRYCDFLSTPAGEETRQRLVDALCREIRQKAAWLRGSGLHGTGEKLWTGRNGLTRREPGGRDGAPESGADGEADLPAVRCEEGQNLLRSGAPGLPQVDTIFFGGGTPSLMTPRQLDRLLFTIADCFQIDDNAEITLECNPGTADYVKLRDFSRIGVNRLSIGVQSFREEELRLLGRIHTAEDARRCVRDARRAGFMNLNLDLMSALPGQTYEQWMENLREAAALEPEHLSAYSLILEEGTPFKADYEAGALPALPEEDEDRRMYHDTKTFLAAKGYRRYEISNYARPGFESRHNNGYWMGHPYLGFGPGAASYLILRADAESGTHPEENFAQANSPKDQRLAATAAMSEMDDRSSDLSSNLVLSEGGRRVRWSNPADLSEYLRQYAEETKTAQGGRIFTELSEGAEYLSREDQMAEFFFLGLRRVRGVSDGDFRAEFGCPVDEIYGPVLRRYVGLGFLRREDGRIALTDPGLDVSNTIMADFLP